MQSGPGDGTTGQEQPPDDFEQFWSVFPKRVGKVDAKRAFAKALKRAPLADILGGARRYAAERTAQDRTYTAHPATWLDKDRWTDEAAPKWVEPQRKRAW
jgi:hypothetical protein